MQGRRAVEILVVGVARRREDAKVEWCRDFLFFLSRRVGEPRRFLWLGSHEDAKTRRFLFGLWLWLLMRMGRRFWEGLGSG